MKKFDEKLIKKSAEQILNAFKLGGVNAATQIYHDNNMSSMRDDLFSELHGKISQVLLNKILNRNN